MLLKARGGRWVMLSSLRLGSRPARSRFKACLLGPRALRACAPSVHGDNGGEPQKGDAFQSARERGANPERHEPQLHRTLPRRLLEQQKESETVLPNHRRERNTGRQWPFQASSTQQGAADADAALTSAARCPALASPLLVLAAARSAFGCAAFAAAPKPGRPSRRRR
jgi:hypothetical protein